MRLPRHWRLRSSSVCHSQMRLASPAARRRSRRPPLGRRRRCPHVGSWRTTCSAQRTHNPPAAIDCYVNAVLMRPRDDRPRRCQSVTKRYLSSIAADRRHRDPGEATPMWTNVRVVNCMPHSGTFRERRTARRSATPHASSRTPTPQRFVAPPGADQTPRETDVGIDVDLQWIHVDRPCTR